MKWSQPADFQFRLSNWWCISCFRNFNNSRRWPTDSASQLATTQPPNHSTCFRINPVPPTFGHWSREAKEQGYHGQQKPTFLGCGPSSKIPSGIFRRCGGAVCKLPPDWITANNGWRNTDNVPPTTNKQRLSWFTRKNRRSSWQLIASCSRRPNYGITVEHAEILELHDEHEYVGSYKSPHYFWGLPSHKTATYNLRNPSLRRNLTSVSSGNDFSIIMKLWHSPTTKTADSSAYPHPLRK